MTKPSSPRSVASPRVQFLADGRAVARADQSNDGKRCEVEIAFDVEERRRRVDFSQCRSAAWLADGDEMGAERFGRFELALGLLRAIEADVMNATATARQHRQRVHGSLGAAELVDQRAEGGRADILGPDQAKPRDALAAVEPDLLVLGVALANRRLLASHQPPDIRGMADVEKHGEKQEQRRKLPPSGQREKHDARRARDKRSER